MQEEWIHKPGEENGVVNTAWNTQSTLKTHTFSHCYLTESENVIPTVHDRLTYSVVYPTIWWTGLSSAFAPTNDRHDV